MLPPSDERHGAVAGRPARRGVHATADASAPLDLSYSGTFAPVAGAGVASSCPSGVSRGRQGKSGIKGRSRVYN
jgi:hypothetical protein